MHFVNVLKQAAVRVALVAVVGLAMTAGIATDARAVQPDLDLISELTGMQASYTQLGPDWVYDAEYQVFLREPVSQPAQHTPDPTARQQALARLSTDGLLFIPDSTNDRIMTFDPVTGDLIDPDFLILNPDETGTPIHAIMGPSSNILVSDQIRDVVYNYDLLSGDYLGIFAPAGGVDTSILDNIRGIALRPNGNLLVSVGGGANADAIAEFDTGGNYLGNFVANGSGNLVSPFDVYGREGVDWLVAGITSDAIHRYDYNTGDYLDDLTPINTFPEQICEAANGNVLVANFSGTQGVYEFTASGDLVDIYNPTQIGGYRGVYELGNGNILTTTGGGVFEIDRNQNLVDTKIEAQARFIEFVMDWTVSIEDLPGDENPAVVPSALAISAVAPNPFNPRTTVHFDLPRPGNATVAIHDLRGRLVQTLVQGTLDSGRHEVSWNGLDAQGNAMPSGVYLARLITADGTRTMKMTLAR